MKQLFTQVEPNTDCQSLNIDHNATILYLDMENTPTIVQCNVKIAKERDKDFTGVFFKIQAQEGKFQIFCKFFVSGDLDLRRDESGRIVYVFKQFDTQNMDC